MCLIAEKASSGKYVGKSMVYSILFEVEKFLFKNQHSLSLVYQPQN